MPLGVGVIGTLAFGTGLLLFGFTVTYGVFGSRWRIVKQARAQYEYRSPAMTYTGFAPRRVIVAMPLFGVSIVAFGLLLLLPPSAADVARVLVPLAIAALVLSLIAFAWPRPFLPRWARDADARRAAGLQPPMPPPDDLLASRRLTRRQLLIGNAVIVGVVVVNIVLGGPVGMTAGAMMAWGYLLAAGAARS